MIAFRTGIFAAMLAKKLNANVGIHINYQSIYVVTTNKRVILEDQAKVLEKILNSSDF